MDLNGFDATQIEPSVVGGGGPVPAGDYTVIIAASEEKQNSKGTGSFLKLEFEIIEDCEYKGSKIWSNLNLNNPSQVAVEIATRELSAICHAVDVMRPPSSVALHDIPLVISVVTESRNDDPTKKTNKITNYTRCGGSSHTPPGPQSNMVGENVQSKKAPWQK